MIKVLIVLKLKKFIFFAQKPHKENANEFSGHNHICCRFYSKFSPFTDSVQVQVFNQIDQYSEALG